MRGVMSKTIRITEDVQVIFESGIETNRVAVWQYDGDDWVTLYDERQSGYGMGEGIAYALWQTLTLDWAECESILAGHGIEIGYEDE